MNVSENVSKGFFTSNKNIAFDNVREASKDIFDRFRRGGHKITYYEKGIELSTGKDMNCQPISNKGQVLKEISKGRLSSRGDINLVEQLTELTKTSSGKYLLGIVFLLVLYTVLFTFLNLIFKAGKGIDWVTKRGKRGLGISGNIKAMGIRGQLKPQNKGVKSK